MNNNYQQQRSHGSVEDRACSFWRRWMLVVDRCDLYPTSCPVLTRGLLNHTSTDATLLVAVLLVCSRMNHESILVSSAG